MASDGMPSLTGALPQARQLITLIALSFMTGRRLVLSIAVSVMMFSL